MFLAAIGQKYPPPPPLRRPENRKPVAPQAREIHLEVMRRLLPDPTPRQFTLALASAQI